MKAAQELATIVAVLAIILCLGRCAGAFDFLAESQAPTSGVAK